MVLEAMIRAGLLTPDGAAAALRERATAMRGMTGHPAWHKAARTLDVWAQEIAEGWRRPW